MATCQTFVSKSRLKLKRVYVRREHEINWHIGASEPEIVVVDEPSSCRWIGP